MIDLLQSIAIIVLAVTSLLLSRANRRLSDAVGNLNRAGDAVNRTLKTLLDERKPR